MKHLDSRHEKEDTFDRKYKTFTKINHPGKKAFFISSLK